MKVCQELTNIIFNYVPEKKKLVTNKLHQEYINYLKSKINIIIIFLKSIKVIKNLCRYKYFIQNQKLCWTKNTLIKFVMVNYIYDSDCGLPDIMIGSYNLNTDLLNIMNDMYYRKAYDIYKFLKQDDITSEMIINCWYTYYCF